MQKITPHLWFDKEAREAAAYYVSVFGGDSKIHWVNTIDNTPSGEVHTVSFRLAGMNLAAISAGPLFKFNPSISFTVACKTKEEVDELWNKLVKDGKVLMELASYPFSERYGWLQDKYGLSWQLIKPNVAEIQQKITPTLMYTGKVSGKTEEAIKFYASVFKDGRVGDIMRYGKGHEPEKESDIAYAWFVLENQRFAAMDSGLPHHFNFNEAISFMVNCSTQEEIDHYWNKLSAVPAAEQCGWLKDIYGVSWQIVPVALGNLLSTTDPKKKARVTEAFMKMKKFDIKKLEEAASIE